METSHGNHLNACQVLKLSLTPQNLNARWPEILVLPLILFNSFSGDLTEIITEFRISIGETLVTCVSRRRTKTDPMVLLNTS